VAKFNGLSLKKVFSFTMNLGAPDLGIDLGTANTLVCIPGRGVVLMEPSVVAVKVVGQSEVVPIDGRAVGYEAKRMIERVPENIRAVRPLKDGVIADFKLTEIMLRYFIRQVQNHAWSGRPRMVISVPSGITEVEKKAVRSSAINAGARRVYTIPESKAGAIGAGVAIGEPVGAMIVDIGGGTTEVAVLSVGEIVTLESFRVAGDEMDQAIKEYVRDVYGLEVGLRTSEEIKIAIGSAYPLSQELKCEVKGKDIAAGLPRKMEVTSEEMREALSQPVQQIVEAVRSCLDKTPPELASDLLDTGITLIGGGSMLPGLDKLLAEQTGLEVTLADDPITAVARGTAMLLERLDEYEDVLSEGE
jgi:rod shape-determining protein MreB